MFRRVLLTVLLASGPGIQAQDCLTLSQVEQIGEGTPGAAGVPQLVLVGHAAVGEPKAALRVKAGPPGGLAQVIVGAAGTETPLPVYGATLHVGAPWNRWLVPLDAQGQSAPLGGGDGPLPASFCGLELAAQALVLDAQAQGGAAFSAALGLRFGSGSGATALFDGMLLQGKLTSTIAMEVADLDGNGRADIVSPTASFNSRIDVAYQLEDGGFTEWQSAGLGFWTRDLDVADMDHDGRLDVVVLGDSVERTIGAAFGQADGSLGPLAVLASESDEFPPTALELADMDGDGWLDAVTLDWVVGSVGVHLGPAAGGLGAPLLQPVGVPALGRSLSVADIDLDGHADVLMLAGTPPDHVAVLYGLGGGTLAPPVAVPIGSVGANGLAIADAVGDPRLDLLVTVEGNQDAGIHASLRLLENQGAGFAPVVILQEELDALATYSGLVVGDMNEDGQDDILVPGNTSVWNPLFAPPASLHVHSGLQPGGSWTTTGSHAGTGVVLRVADVDADTHLDLVHDMYDILLGHAGVLVNHGRGDGTFDLPPDASPQLIGLRRATGDFDEDGRADIAVPSVEGSSFVRIGLGSADATLLPAATIPVPGWPNWITAADLNGDGHLDLAVTTLVGSLAVVPGHGDGSFAPAVEIAPPPGVQYKGFLATGDVDGDGVIDLVTAANAGSASEIRVLLGTGGTTFGAPLLTTLSPGLSSTLATLADMDGDGRADLLFTGKVDGGLFVAFAAGGGSFAAPTLVTPDAKDALYPGPPVGDVDGDGDLDVIVRAPDVLHARVALNDGTGQFSVLPGFPYRGLETRLADVNGDGRLDLLGSGVALGFGDGTFAPQDPGLVFGHAADVDGDGDLDVVAFGPVWENRLY